MLSLFEDSTEHTCLEDKTQSNINLFYNLYIYMIVQLQILLRSILKNIVETNEL